MGRSVLAALGVAHEANIVHRDVKPANILIDSEGLIKLADFGVALVGDAVLTQTGVVIGTPAYMAPEQLRGRDVDGRADLYALGATLFEAATGRKLHAKEASVRDPEAAVLEATAHPGLAHTIGRAVREDPDRRYQTVTAFDGALTQAEAGAEPSSSMLTSAVVRQRRTTWISFSVALMAGLSLTLAAALAVQKTIPWFSDEKKTAQVEAVRLALFPFFQQGASTRAELRPFRPASTAACSTVGGPQFGGRRPLSAR